ncbi:MAG: retroviral-like aspartic protease family protein [Caulobacter sp.]|nr:retroviral-like aspartic protease family protein [Caulobacter sp.]
MIEGLSRRGVLGGLMASPVAACVSTPERATVQVNLQSGGLPSPDAEAAPDQDGAVRAGFDAVRRMLVDVAIDGAGLYRFVVDTGANRSVLSTEVAAALNLPVTGQALVHGIAGVMPSPTVLVRALAVGDLLTRRVRMPVLDGRYLGADGLLGVDVLANRRAVLNFREQSFSLFSGSAPAPAVRSSRDRRPPEDTEDVVVVPARHRFGQLTIVDAEIGGVKLTAFLDSGAENTVGNMALRNALQRPGLLNERLPRVELVSATGQIAVGELSTVPPLRLGGVRLGNLTCVFADLHTFRIWDLEDRPALLIGVDVMRHFDAIELNFRERLVKFRSNQFDRTLNAGR